MPHTACLSAWGQFRLFRHRRYLTQLTSAEHRCRQRYTTHLDGRLPSRAHSDNSDASSRSGCRIVTSAFGTALNTSLSSSCGVDSDTAGTRTVSVKQSGRCMSRCHCTSMCHYQRYHQPRSHHHTMRPVQAHFPPAEQLYQRAHTAVVHHGFHHSRLVATEPCNLSD